MCDPDAAPDPAMDRSDGSLAMLTIHVPLGVLFLLLSVTQFLSELWNVHRGLHRLSGIVTMTAGIIAVLSGVGLVVIYTLSELATPAMDTLRFIFGVGLVLSISIAFVAIRKRDAANHRVWMIRAFALAVAGSTQALVIGRWLAFAGPVSPESATALVAIGFFINIVFAEWRIRAFSFATPI